MLPLPTLKYRKDDRIAFKDGELINEWGGEYDGILFDDQNIRIALNHNKSGKSYYFVEWFAAVQFHRAFGYHAVTHRQARNQDRLRKVDPVLRRYPGLMEYLTSDELHVGKKIMFPDVFLHNPNDPNDWLMIECKGPGDRLRPHQVLQNAKIESLCDRPILLLPIRPSSSAEMSLDQWKGEVQPVLTKVVGNDWTDLCEQAGSWQTFADMEKYLSDFVRWKTRKRKVALEVGVVEWDCQTPRIEWHTAEIFESNPSPEQKDAAIGRLLRNKTYFRVCSRCFEINNIGHMGYKGVCQSCAEKYHGVVY